MSGDVARNTKVSTEALIAEYVERFQSLDAGNRISKETLGADTFTKCRVLCICLSKEVIVTG